MDTILNYLQLIWWNVYLKWFVIYLVYLLIFYFIIAPIVKLAFMKFMEKTTTNLDNELYGRTRWLWKILFIFIWLNLIYKFYFQDILDEKFIILYNVILSIEFLIFFVIVKKSITIILKYMVRKYSNVFWKNIANIIKVITNIIIVSVFILLVLSVWWINITPLLASAGIFGLAIAMASKSIIENFLSWMILFADKTVNVWDTIILSDGTTAVVEEVNVRTTKLKTFDGNLVIIPNSELLNDKITNKTQTELSPYRRVMVSVWISYWDDIEKAKELLKSYLLEIEWSDESTAVTYLDTMADWSLNITWKIMVEADKWSYLLEKQILERVYKEFPQNGLNFPFPTYEINRITGLGQDLQDQNRI